MPPTPQKPKSSLDPQAEKVTDRLKDAFDSVSKSFTSLADDAKQTIPTWQALSDAMDDLRRQAQFSPQAAPQSRQAAPSGDKSIAQGIATGLQTAFTALQQGVTGLRAAAGGWLSETIGLGSGLRGLAAAGVALGNVAKTLVSQFAQMVAGMVGLGVAVAFTIDKLASLPLQVLQKSIASVSSEVASFVKLAAAGVFQRFQRAVDDLYASIGIALAPLLEKLTQVFRSIGSAIFSLSGNGQTALRVLAAMSVSFVTFGVAIAGLATTAIIGTIAIKGLTAAIAIMEAVASGGIAIPIAIAASLDFLGTSGAALAGVMAALAGVTVAVTGMMEDLTPVLNVMASAFMGFMDSLGAAFKAFAQGGVLNALAGMFASAAASIGSFIKQLAPAFAVLVDVGVKLLPVFSTIVSILAQVTAAPFLLLGKVIQATGDFISAFAESFSTVFSEVSTVLFDLLKVFGELVAEVLIFNPVAMLAIGALKELSIVMAGFALAVADAVKKVVGWIRLLFGIDTPIRPEQPGAKPSDNTGAAATSVSTGDPRDALRRSREAAFQMGTGAAKPDEQTAKNTGEIAKAIQEWRTTFGSIATNVEQLPDKIRGYMEAAASVVTQAIGKIGISPTANAAGGKPTGTVLDNIPAVSLGGVIQEQLKRLNLNPFS